MELTAKKTEIESLAILSFLKLRPIFPSREFCYEDSWGILI
jgi:hypothetical protein